MRDRVVAVTGASKGIGRACAAAFAAEGARVALVSRSRANLNALRAAGFTAITESDEWRLGPGDRRYVVRDGSILAFELGMRPPAESGFRIVGADTDSPNLRIKPQPAVESQGYVQLAIEPYGGVLLHSWLDRDLSLAGRVSLLRDGAVETVLVDFARPILRIPDLAIHLQREIREQGLKLNAQTQMTPVFALAGGESFEEALSCEIERSAGLRVPAGDIASYELMTYDTLRAEIGGASDIRGIILKQSAKA